MRRNRWAATGAVALAVLVATQLLPDQLPLGVVLRGALFGTATGLLAVGLVLTYRTTRIINFSYGAMGSIGGGLAAALAVGKGWNWGLAALAGIATGAVVGYLVELLVVRRFATAPRLVLTVATIGLAQLLGGIAIYLPTWLGTPAYIPEVPTALADTTITLDPVIFTGNDLVLLAVVPVVLAGLTWFLYFSDAGMAVRGMADNMDRARLLGIPVNQLSSLLWTVAGAVAALTVVLRAPSEGVPLNAAAGPTVLLPALAAAVVVGMQSLPGAFVAGVFLGVLDQVVLWNVDNAAPTPVVLLAVIVVALLLRRRSSHRTDESESTWSMVGVGHRLPRAYAALAEVRAAKVAFGVLLAAGLVALPLLGSDAQVNFGTVTLAYAVVALSLVVLTGWGGVVSLGQVAVMGVGGVVTANLIADRNLDLFASLGLSAVAGGLVALVLGLPALRVSGQFLAVTTLAFAVAMELYVLNPANYSEWLPPAYERPELWGALELSNERWLYALALAMVVGAVYVVRNLRAARAGRSIAATRDNERGAAAAGINTMETRLAAFIFSGILAGIAGGLHAVALRGIGQSTYPTTTSLLVFSMAVIGGVTSVSGALAGVALVQWAGYLFPRAQLLLTGVGLLAILLVMPGGLVQAFERVRDAVVRRIARRRGLVDHEVVETVEEAVEPGAGMAIRRDASGASLVVGGLRRERLGTHLLTCEGLEASYGSLQVLFGVDVQVERNELLALLGTNGAGKSTVLKTIAGLVPPTTGRITFDGRDITGLPAEEIARLGLSLMPGGQGVFPTLTVAENLRLACWMVRDDREAVEHRIDEAIAMFPVLGEREDQLAGDLSGGEQQQLSLAMAFVKAEAAVHRRAVARPGADGRRPPRREGPGDPRPGHDRRRGRAVGQRRPAALPPGDLPGEGPGAVPGPDRRPARPARHPAGGVHRRRPGPHGGRRARGGPAAVGAADAGRHARGPGHHQAVRRSAGARRRQPDRPPGDDRRPDRPQRGREDDAVRRPHRLPAGRRRRGAAGRRGRHPLAAAQAGDRPGRPHVPGGPPLPVAHGRGGHRGLARAAPRQPRPAGGGAAAAGVGRRGGRGGRAGGRAHRHARAGALRRPADGRAVHRHAADRRAGVPAGAGPGGRALRRALGRRRPA